MPGKGASLLRPPKIEKPQTEPKEFEILDEAQLDAMAQAKVDQIRKPMETAFVRMDTNGDGLLTADEKAAAERAATDKKGKKQSIFHQYDLDRNGKLDEIEGTAAKDQFRAQFQKHNETLLRKYDENKDGKLDDAEIAKAKEQIRLEKEQKANRPAKPAKATP